MQPELQTSICLTHYTSSSNDYRWERARLRWPFQEFVRCRVHNGQLRSETRTHKTITPVGTEHGHASPIGHCDSSDFLHLCRVDYGDVVLASLLTLGAKDHVVRRVNSVSHFTRTSKLSNRTSPCSKRSIRGIRLHGLLRKNRNRPLQLAKWHAREHRFKTDRSERAAYQKPTSMPSLGPRLRP